MVREVTARELSEQLSGPGAAPLLVDVRETWEWQIAHIDGALHMPMNLVPLRMAELPDERPLVIVCHHGVRSYQVARYLIDAGFDDVASLRGGIEAWACDVDPSLAHY
ncbi:rhodanese-like domain-containing protein [Paludibacterium paludis]|uniref:Sulfurtransferase n=1 Tax=Paludibacterium paludis TaxID=1225769 RepID=A0A918P1L3_9NEIS|nr:rhodanese-like domain-containing protein [Paludibacterium paludis]GGY12481.1 sulfurtransferase [Paludibacterium paludis]